MQPRALMKRIVWMAKGVALFGSFAVGLALILGVATTALAAVPGDPLELGETNTINNSFTKLVGSNDGDAMLKVDNNSSAGGSRALDLRVEAGREPINVNSDAGKATNLDSDELDGLDSTAFLQESTDRHAFLPRRTYIKYGRRKVDDQGSIVTSVVRCDDGDVALTGGYYGYERTTFHFDFEILEEKVSGDEYTLLWSDESGAGNVGYGGVTPNVTCADFGPWHLIRHEGPVDPNLSTPGG